MINLNRLIQAYQRLLNHLKTKSQISLLILSLITLISCKQISGYLCGHNIEVWYEYFVIVERISMLFLLLSVFKSIRDKYWLLSELILLFLLQDIIDRLFFDIKHVTINDYITVNLLFIISAIKYINKIKNKNNDNSRTNKQTI